MSSPPLVFTIVLNWNGLADTRECLASLLKASYSNNRVLVVDNGSDADEAGAIQREFGEAVQVLRNPSNLGFAGGMNAGIQRALEEGADYVLLLNNDVTVDPAFLAAMLQTAQRHPDFAAASPRAYFRDQPQVIYSTGGRVSLWTGTARQMGRGQPDRGQFEQEQARDYADGVCMLMSRDAIQRVGLLDESYFMYWEETDWCFRARRHGLRCYYSPSAKVWHRAARSLSPTDEYHYQYQRNALLFVRKNGKPLQVATAFLAHLFLYAPWYVIRRPGRIGRALAEWRAVCWNARFRGGTRNQPRQRPLV